MDNSDNFNNRIFFNIKKKSICFYFWIICEIMCMIIDLKNNQYGRAFLDLFCLGMNIYGRIAWPKSSNNTKKIFKDYN